MKNSIFIILLSTVLVSCFDPSKPNFQYFPDMYESLAYETYAESDGFSNGIEAQIPVEGTIPRGKLLTFNYEGSLEGYLLAGDNVINPYASSSENIEDGKKLYAMFCTHCHGDLGDGKGSINHPVYSAIPAYNDNNMARRTGSTMSELKAGHIFHAITYGLNAMGPHASQLSEEERWKIVLYVQTLQQTSQK